MYRSSAHLALSALAASASSPAGAGVDLQPPNGPCAPVASRPPFAGPPAGIRVGRHAAHDRVALDGAGATAGWDRTRTAGSGVRVLARRRWLIRAAAGVAAAAGMVLAAPGSLAFACGGEELAAVSSGSAAAAVPAEVLRSVVTPSPVQVTGPVAMDLPERSATLFLITVANNGPNVTGKIRLGVRAEGPQGMPDITIDTDETGTRRWKELPSEGAMGMSVFTADGLSFQTGQASFEFRVNVPGAALGQRLSFTVKALDAAGRPLGSIVIHGTVTDATLRVQTTFPGRLQRGGPYREFDVKVGNPSTSTYHNVAVSLGLFGVAAAPTTTDLLFLAPGDVRLAERVGGAWTRLTVHPGDCDPGLGAKLGGPFDLAPGATRNLHLRVRLADSTPAQLRSVEYVVSAAPRMGEAQSVSGHFVIEPRRASTGKGSDGPEPSRTTGSGTSGNGPAASGSQPAASGSQPAASGSQPAASGSQPAASGSQPAASGSQPAALTSEPVGAAARLAHTGAVALPLAGGIALLLGGVIAWRRLRPTGG